VKVALVAALSCLSSLLNCVFWTLLCACCSLRLIALDGYTFNVRVGSLNHSLPLDSVSHCLGSAGSDAAANPLDLRLRCIKVSRRLRLYIYIYSRDFYWAVSFGCAHGGWPCFYKQAASLLELP
jgi:hypothetical protein